MHREGRRDELDGQEGEAGADHRGDQRRRRRARRASLEELLLDYEDFLRVCDRSAWATTAAYTNSGSSGSSTKAVFISAIFKSKLLISLGISLRPMASITANGVIALCPELCKC